MFKIAVALFLGLLLGILAERIGRVGSYETEKLNIAVKNCLTSKVAVVTFLKKHTIVFCKSGKEFVIQEDDSVEFE